MPLAMVRTSTSPGRGGASSARRSSPRPGVAIQNARALPPSAIEDAFVEDVLAEIEAAQARPQALVRLDDFRQRQAMAPGAEDDRRDGELQPVERASDEEARDGDAAAFDEQEIEPARRESIADVARREAALAARHGYDLRLPDALARSHA